MVKVGDWVEQRIGGTLLEVIETTTCEYGVSCGGAYAFEYNMIKVRDNTGKIGWINTKDVIEREDD